MCQVLINDTCLPKAVNSIYWRKSDPGGNENRVISKVRLVLISYFDYVNLFVVKLMHITIKNDKKFFYMKFAFEFEGGCSKLRWKCNIFH